MLYEVITLLRNDLRKEVVEVNRFFLDVDDDIPEEAFGYLPLLVDETLVLKFFGNLRTECFLFSLRVVAGIEVANPVLDMRSQNAVEALFRVERDEILDEVGYGEVV